MNTLKFKKGDEVKVISGSAKGTVAKVVQAFPKKNAVTLEGIGIVKRKVKPSQLNPKGGTKEVHMSVPVSNVALVESEKTTKKPVAKKTERSKK